MNAHKRFSPLDNLRIDTAGLDEVDEETPEEALEKLEDDLAETLGITEAKEEAEPVTDGTKRVVKRVRKKPSTTTKYKTSSRPGNFTLRNPKERR